MVMLAFVSIGMSSKDNLKKSYTLNPSWIYDRFRTTYLTYGHN